MALRIARGLFRLWLILSVLWIGGVGATTNWGWYLSYQPTIPGEQPPGKLEFTAQTCTAAKKPEECSAMLEAVGKNPFDAYDLKWTDGRWDFADNTVMVPVALVWERAWPRAAKEKPRKPGP
jgi:hypothetical protein